MGTAVVFCGNKVGLQYEIISPIRYKQIEALEKMQSDVLVKSSVIPFEIPLSVEIVYILATVNYDFAAKINVFRGYIFAANFYRFVGYFITI